MRYLASILFIFAIVIAAIDVLHSDISRTSGTSSPYPVITTNVDEAQKGTILPPQQIPLDTVQSEREGKVTSLARTVGGFNELSDLLRSKRELEEYLKLYPTLALQLAEVILDPNTKPRAQLALIHSLSVVGGAQAEQVLIELAASKTHTATVRLQAITSIAELSAPSYDVINTLWRISEDESVSNPHISESALLNLGILARSVENTLPDTAHQIISRLAILTKEAQEQSASSFQILLESMANSGSREVLPIANELLHNSNPEMRALGIHSIRLLPGKEIENQILTVAEGDDSAIVRSAALEAIHTRQPNEELISRLSTLLFEEEDNETRRKIITYLGERAYKYPESKNKLRELLTAESDQENYALAVRFLY
jgi:hypothetical protein